MSKVMFSQPAEFDLISIENYIQYTLLNPDSARKVVDKIIETAEKLSLFPEEHPLVSDIFLAELGFRITQYGNYNIFYIYEHQKDIVHIIRILYNRADWNDILR